MVLWMSKIIIENRTDIPMELILPKIGEIISEGRVSETSKGKQYCFATRWPDGLTISTSLNKESDKFLVTHT